MIVTGIIVEYNPFHNGHIKHIEKARKLTNCDVLIAVMSGNFVQRGEPSIFDKFSKTKTALLNNVDIVLELPFPYVNQNATKFAQASTEILNLAKCDYIVFGSELNDLETLLEYSEFSINLDNLKELMDSGISYPKAYGMLADNFLPNDILGIAYLKALKNTNIVPKLIKRDNHHKTLKIKSASNIREKINQNHLDINQYTPMLNYVDIKNKVVLSDFYSLLRTKLLNYDKSYLSKLALFAEGIENHLYKLALRHYTYESFIKAAVSKRYTKARINRTLVSLLVNLKQSDLDNLPDLNQLKVLGFNEVGQKYLKHLIKNKVDVVSKFKRYNKTYAHLELLASSIYSLYLDEKVQKKLWDKEFSGPIIYKNNKFYNDL